MTEALATAIAQIDDPEAIKDILAATGGDHPQQPDIGATDQPTLASLFERFLARRTSRSPATRGQYKRTIPQFIGFAENQDVTAPEGLSTELLDAYVASLNTKYDQDATILTYTKNVRTWLHWLSKRDYCQQTVYHVLDKDELGLSPTARDHAIPESEARFILEKLRQQRYGTALHALLELKWNAGPRLGAVYALDVEDFDPELRSIRIRHRPETGTRLKNGSRNDGSPGDGERDVVLNDRVVDALIAYIMNERIDVLDDHGRAPLFTTNHGRAAKSTLRRWIYAATSCRWATNLSDDAECDGSCDPDSNVCPNSYYPHALRRGSIVNHLSNGLRRDWASERFNVSMRILKKHYDPRTKRQMKEDRADAVRNAWSEW